jgi:hypothetical protein
MHYSPQPAIKRPTIQGCTSILNDEMLSLAFFYIYRTTSTDTINRIINRIINRTINRIINHIINHTI